MALHVFENLEVWKRSSRLAVDINIAIHSHPNFGLKDQISRSAISVPSNIAEGAERDSPKDFIRFLRIAKGSLAELRTQLYINERVSRSTGSGHLPDTSAYITETKEILAVLQGLINSLQVTIESTK